MSEIYCDLQAFDTVLCRIPPILGLWPSQQTPLGQEQRWLQDETGNPKLEV